MKFLLTNILFLLITTHLFAQTDWKRWDKAEYDFRLENNFRQRNYSFDTDNIGQFFIKSFVNIYWFFVSDVDGDNCHFRPSCSAFFVDAVKETNIFQGSLMFFDRFTRDLNVFKEGKYPQLNRRYYYDPAALYSLSPSKIRYIPPNEIMTSK